MGVPVACLGISKWRFEFATQMLNYVHVQQTSVMAGMAPMVWSTALQLEFERRWTVVPLIGGTMGQIAIPRFMLALVITSCAFHGLSAIFFFLRPGDEFVEEQADAANLLFLGKALAGDGIKPDIGGNGLSRMTMGLLTKLPMIWVKTSPGL